jgi:hypothetical protein
MCVGWIGRPGGDLLSRALRRSTMGAGVFHGRVRDGIGCRLPAMATRSSNPPGSRFAPGDGWVVRVWLEFVCVRCGEWEGYWPIGKLMGWMIAVQDGVFVSLSGD